MEKEWFTARSRAMIAGGHIIYLVTNTEDESGDYHSLVSVANFLLTRRAEDEERTKKGLGTVRDTGKKARDEVDGQKKGMKGPRATFVDMSNKEINSHLTGC